jgi:DNA modification methylase
VEIQLINDNNLNFNTEKPINLIYSDMIYENMDFTWINHYWNMLSLNGIFIVQTDYHTVAEIKIHMQELPNAEFLNWVIYLQWWGGVPKDRFPQKHDDILIFRKGKTHKWYPNRIQIPKVTAGTKLDKKGTGLKTPCSVFYDLGNFSTISKERIKNGDKNIQWQKPLKLMSRLLLPFTDENDWILDPFLGSGTTGVWCKHNNRNFVGIELDKEVFDIAKKRIENE